MHDVDFISLVHKSTKRDYLKRITEYPKAEAAKKAKLWDYDYWDGDRRICYGGYHYDGRWQKVAQAMIDHYQLKPGDKVLDVGCGKGFLLHDFKILMPELEVKGVDISEYALEHAKEEVKQDLKVCSAAALPFADNSFNLVISINTLHNLYCYELETALQEISRVSKGDAYICVESYRNEEEKANLLYWQVTCESFYTPKEWQWWFDRCGYHGDHSFIYFE